MAPESQPYEGAEHAANAAFPPFDPTYFASQLFWLAISFGLLYFLLSRFVLPRIGNTIEERRDRIADDLDAAADLKSQSDETVAVYERELADARSRASKVASDAKADADSEIAEAMAEADKELDAKLAESEAQITKSREAALAQVRTIAAETALAAVDHLTGLDVKLADAEKAVDKVKG